MHTMTAFHDFSTPQDPAIALRRTFAGLSAVLIASSFFLPLWGVEITAPAPAPSAGALALALVLLATAWLWPTRRESL